MESPIVTKAMQRVLDKFCEELRQTIERGQQEFIAEMARLGHVIEPDPLRYTRRVPRD